MKGEDIVPQTSAVKWRVKMSDRGSDALAGENWFATDGVCAQRIRARVLIANPAGA